MSANPDRSTPVKIARLLRDALAAEVAGRINEAVSLLQDVAQLDGRDLRTLHRLGDLHRNRLNNSARAASWYAREARCHEQEGAAVRAIAAWRLVVRCAPARLEAYERIGALYVDLGHVADARIHYETSARELLAAGLAAEAAILRAHLEAIEPVAEPVAAPPTTPAVPGEEPDADALSLAAEREQYARLYYHHGMHALARQQLEDLIASLPDHVPARELLVDVCRALGDAPAAAEHLRVLTDLLRRDGGNAPAADARRGPTAEAPGHGAPDDEPCELPPFEEWSSPELDVTAAEIDVTADLMDAVRDDLERFVDTLGKGPVAAPARRPKTGGL